MLPADYRKTVRNTLLTIAGQLKHRLLAKPCGKYGANDRRSIQDTRSNFYRLPLRAHLVVEEVVRQPAALLPEHRHEEGTQHVHVPPVRPHHARHRRRPQRHLTRAHHHVVPRAGRGERAGGMGWGVMFRVSHLPCAVSGVQVVPRAGLQRCSCARGRGRGGVMCRVGALGLCGAGCARMRCIAYERSLIRMRFCRRLWRARRGNKYLQTGRRYRCIVAATAVAGPPPAELRTTTPSTPSKERCRVLKQKGKELPTAGILQHVLRLGES